MVYKLTGAENITAVYLREIKPESWGRLYGPPPGSLHFTLFYSGIVGIPIFIRHTCIHYCWLMRGDFSLISRHLTQILRSTYPSIMLSELTIYIGNINSLHAGARSLILFPFITNRKPSFTKSLCRYICTYLKQIKTIVYKYLWNLSGLLSKIGI